MRNGQRIVHDAGVGRQKARHVRPVFVQVRAQTTRHDGSGNIAAAAVEQFNLSIFGGAVKARHDKAARTILGCLAQTFARALLVQRSVVIEHHGICRIHERHVQKLRHHARGKVLSPADDELLRIATGLRTLAKQAELLADGIRDTQLARYLRQADANGAEQVIAADVVVQMRVHQVKKIGNFHVVLVPLAHGRHHDESARRVCRHDVAHFAKLPRAGNGASAELCHLHSVFLGHASFLSLAHFLSCLAGAGARPNFAPRDAWQKRNPARSFSLVRRP